MDNHDRFIRFLEEHFFAPEDVIYSAIKRKTFAPLDESLFEDAIPYSELPKDKVNLPQYFVPGYTRSELLKYEDSNMASGAAMNASVLEYRRTGAPEALARAQRLYRGLKKIEETGSTFESGFITKFYGGRFTKETSTDQCLYHIYGLDAYFEVATGEERCHIRKIVPEIVRFWIRHNYTYTYFEWENMKWPPLRFPSLLAIAWEYSHEEIFRSEFERIISENIDCVPEFNCIDRYRGRRFSDYEEKHNIRFLNNMAVRVTMDIMNLSLMLRVFPEHRYAAIWKKGIKTIWEQSRNSLLPDGRYQTLKFYEADTGKTVEPYDDCPLPWAKSAWSTMIVRGGLMGLPYMPEYTEEVVKHTENVLGKLEPEAMTYMEELHQYPDDQRFKERFLSGDAIADYLWAYELLQTVKGKK
ncbi:MAG: hypothetical protein J5944_07685 [Lentisphaeria bacterium]|nr:hypothetical protein [Lentisphaeria bacterium]